MAPYGATRPHGVKHFDPNNLLITLIYLTLISVQYWTKISTDSWPLVHNCNPVAPRRYNCIFEWVILKFILMIHMLQLMQKCPHSYATKLHWSVNIGYVSHTRCIVLLFSVGNRITTTTNQVVAWQIKATSHYRNQCPPRSKKPCGFTWPEWVNILKPSDA